MNSETLEHYRYNGSTGLQASQAPYPVDIETRLKIFHQGDTKAFDTPSLIKTIAQHILDLYHKGDMGNALILLENLGEAALSDTIEHREKSLITLSTIAEKVLDEENEDLLEAISHMLIRWLKKETEFISGYEFICIQLSSLVRKMIDLGMWYQSEDLIVSLHDIRKGRIKKSNILTQIVSKVQSRIADSRNINQLIEAYLDTDNEKSDVAGTMLIHLGEWSIPLLIQKLALSKDKAHRYRLLELIPAAGNVAIPALVKNLGAKPPWYLARNIILMISKIADPSLYPHIRPFMRHSDIRVQQEVIDCLKKMNNEERTERLLEAINICNDKLKPQLVRTLSDAKERRVAHAFIGLLNNYTIFASQTRNDIIQEVCRYLPQYITEKTVPTLRDLIANASNDNSLHPETLQVINNAYAVLKETTLSPMERNLHASGFEEKEADVLPLTAEPLRKLRPPEDYALSKPKERGWFEHAISNPKLPSQLKKHMLRRKDLYCQLRHDEFLALSSLLSHKEYQAGQTLVAKGDVHSLLYFIEDGGVSIDFHDTKAKTAAMNLGMGDLIGHDVFMGGSEWHITLTAVRKTEVFLFDQEQLLYLQPSFSNLCSTILDYSKNNDVILRLYEAAVRDTICADNSGPVAFTGSGGDFLVDVAIHAMLPLGVCFCFSLPQGIDSSVFLDRELQVFMKTPAFSNHLVKAHIIGTRFLEENNRSLCIMARFLEEQPAHDSCRCLSISL